MRAGFNKRLLFLALLILSLLVLGLVFNLSTSLNWDWDWTGIAGKSLWDWLQLLIVPAVLAGVGLVFNSRQKRDELDIADESRQHSALEHYLDVMSKLLIENHLRESTKKDDVRRVARGWTLAVIPVLNGDRKASVLRFLYESRLIDRDSAAEKGPEAGRNCESELCVRSNSPAQPILSLDRVDFSHTNMPRGWLEHACLRKVDFRNCHLKGVTFKDADLSSADFSNSILEDADFSNSVLAGAKFHGANLTRANFSGSQCLLSQIEGDHVHGEIRARDSLLPPK